MQALINIDVDDLDAAMRFYREAFGLAQGRRVAGRWVELLGAGAPIFLLAKPAGTPAHAGRAQGRDYGRHWTPVHLDFITEDIEAAVARARGAGAQLEQPVSTHEWGRLALMADPFGHGFCFVQFLGAGYDAVATAQP